MADYLTHHGIEHIFGTPYHPQGRGKIERLNRRLKEKLCLVVYCSPDELKRAIDEAIQIYNQTPHESLENVSPNDVYHGRKAYRTHPSRMKKISLATGDQPLLQAFDSNRQKEFQILLSVSSILPVPCWSDCHLLFFLFLSIILLIMSPHPENLYNLLVPQNLINEAVLNVDSPRIGSFKITHQFLIGRRCFKRILFQELQQLFSFRFQSRTF